MPNQSQSRTDHLGNEYPSVKAMCEAWGVTYAAYYQRLKRGWTLEETLTGSGPRPPHKGRSLACTDHLGNEFPSIKAMCERWGVNYSAYIARVQRGWTVGEALTGQREESEQSCTDHLGQIFPDVKAMCERWGVVRTTYIERLKRGWSLEEALTVGDRVGHGKRCTDHEGREFASIKDMCEAWGAEYNKYEARRCRGWTVEEALTGNRAHGRGKPCTDHLGREYPSVKAMCKAWGVSFNTYNSRLRSGWSLEKALTSRGSWAGRKGKPCADHTGCEYPTLTAMCEAWGIKIGTFEQRRRSGWTVEEALTGNRAHGGGKPCTDHLGQSFPSKQAMCDHWGVGRVTYHSRCKLGWSVEEALTGTGPYRTGTPCTDHTGREFPSIKAMLEHWGITRAAYNSRLERGWTQEEALTGKRKAKGA